MSSSALTQRLGKYHVLARIAQGGMAEIYKAKTVGIAGFEKILALKRILPTFAREARFIRSFIDEARIAVTLNHRNIVQVFDFGKADGELYLAMELIEGVDLKSAMSAANEASVAMPPAVACCILADVAAGLDYAHRKADGEGRPLGIVHCDVSPQNVMLSYEGFIKILDFGVARARFANPPREKRLRGKPRYMAPEQTRGLIPTPATDVFALGILCWELLTGLPLFEGSDLGEILAAVRRADAPRVSSLNPDVPEYLSEAIARALAPQPDRRGDAGELAIALARTARELTPLPSSRAIADWLAEVLGQEGPGTGDSTGELTAEFMATPSPDAVPEPITSTTTNTGSTTIITEVGEVPASSEMPTGPAARIAFDIAGSSNDLDVDADAETEGPARALVENRRVVATAVVADGGERETRRELSRMVAELAYKHGALVHGHSPDGLVAVFGLEVAGEDDIASAMQFSLDAVELARETTGADRSGAPSLRVATRAGIAAQRSPRTLRLRGDAVEEARALAREAEPNRPLLTGGTGRLASAQFAFRDLPARRLRSRRLRVLELLGPRDFDERARALHERRGRFVGRSAELERMDRAMESALAEERRTVIAVIGGAGVGKSRLVAEFVARVQGRPHTPRLIALAASPVARDAPFWLVGDLLQSALNLPPRRGRAARGALIQRLRHVLAGGMERAEQDECLGAVELALELRDGAMGAADHAQASADLRERVASALRSVRRSLQGPVLWVVEDLHLADATSGDALRSALRSTDASVTDLVLLTSRSPLEGLPPETEFIELGDLEEPERGELIADRLAEAASRDAITAVGRRARGNPLFIEELATAVRELGQPGEVPAGVRDVLIARVDRLPAATRATLQHAAVVGPVFRSRILEELLGPAVHTHLQELVDEGMVVRADFGAAEVDEGELAFQHGLLQEVVYESLAGAARRRTHARLGRLLSARLDAGREEPPLLVARHLELGGQPAHAAAVWLRAGQVALAAHDAAKARDAFTRVLELDVQANGAGSGEAQSRRRDALLGREQANRELGDHDAQAIDLAQLDVVAAGDLKLEADVANRRATRLLRIGDYAGAVAAAEAAAAAARTAGDELSRGEALRVLGEAYERTGQFERGLEVVEEAVDILARAGAAHAEMKARIGIGRNHLTRSHYEKAWETYEPILERLDETADPWLERVVRNHVAVIHLCLGEFEAAMWSAKRSMELCDFYGDRARAGDNLSVCGIILTEVGQFAEARERFSDALAIHDQTRSRWSRADCQVYAGANQACLGEFAAGVALLEESRASARQIGARYVEANGEVAMAGLLLRRSGEGDEEAAVAAADRALECARAATLVGAEIVALTRRAEALRRLGRGEEALASSRRAIELLEKHKYLEGSEEEVLFVHYRVLSTTGDREAADDFLARAKSGIERKLEMLTNPAWQTSYIDAIPLHQLIVTAEPSPAN